MVYYTADKAAEIEKINMVATRLKPKKYQVPECLNFSL